MPPFEQIKSAHFSEAFELALQRNQVEIDQIANQRPRKPLLKTPC
jgi:Zn-dependent oligopeptidase